VHLSFEIQDLPDIIRGNARLSLAIVAHITGFFLVGYRSKSPRFFGWKMTLLETAVTVLIGVIVSLLIGGIA
jgi:hypothetical protein